MDRKKDDVELYESPTDGSTNESQPKRFLQHAGAFTVNISAFAVGNTLAWSSPATPLLLKGDAGFSVNEYENSLIGSLLAIGAALSCLPAGYVTDKVGRKTTALGLVPLYLLGWGLIIWAKSVEMLCAGRFILGLCAGTVCVTAPVYAAEICQKEIRGALGSYYQLLLSGGILFTYIVGSQLNLFGLSLTCGMVPVVFGITFFFFPETPVYFLANGQPEKARKSLKFFRGSFYDLESELCELAESSEQTNTSRGTNANEESSWDVFLSKRGIKSLSLAIGMMIFQQLSGINAIIFYTTSIFEDAGSSLEPKYATIIAGCVQFVTTFFVVFLADRVGRVVLLGTSALFMSISTFVLGLYFYLRDDNYNVDNFSWLPLISLCVFLVVFSIGYGPIPWAVLPEIIPSKIKGTSSSIACVINWVCAFLVTKFFSDFVSAINSGPTFWIFSVISAVGTVFSYRLPETKGKTFEEIQRKLEG